MSKIKEATEIAEEFYEYAIVNKNDFVKEKSRQLMRYLDLIFELETTLDNNEDYSDEIAKVKRKVPKWMKKTHQYNYLILKAFMDISDYNEHRVSVEELEEYVDIGQAFLANYNNLKTISEKNHGKVFDEIDGEVELWEPVAEFIEGVFMYNKYFSQFLINNNNRNKYMHFNHSNNKSYVSKKFQGFTYGVVLVSSKAKAYGFDFTGLVVELYIDNENPNETFGKLSQYRDEIANKFIDTDIYWQDSSETRSGNVCRIYAKKDVDIGDTSRWEEYIDWQVNTLIQFLEVFPGYTQRINS